MSLTLVSPLHQLVHQGQRFGDAVAIQQGARSLTYRQLWLQVNAVSAWLNEYLQAGDRVAIYLPKTLEACVALFAVSAAGGVVVPINPVLKATQVAHILQDSGAVLCITQRARYQPLNREQMRQCQFVLLDAELDTTLAWPQAEPLCPPQSHTWAQPQASQLAALLYTSGSTGLPKGVMVSHGNLITGTEAVLQYTQLSKHDVILAVLPFSFDYGLNQLLTALACGARCILLDYLFPQDIVKACVTHGVTVLAGVPPLWAQLAGLAWPQSVQTQMRLMTNSGGHLTQQTIQQLQEALPSTDIMPMYGLTEAFRSSYLPPAELNNKPDSIGKAIPYAKLWVLDADGKPCAPNQPGELVHSGPLVALGYWQRPEQTRQRFKPLPATLDPSQNLAVWSGDKVYQDVDGYLYFVGRMDNQLKVSGYRISPEEIETVLQQQPHISQAVVLGQPDPALGQRLMAIVETTAALTEQDCQRHSRQHLPAYMQPQQFVLLAQLPRNANGKIDRAALQRQYCV